MSVQRDKRTERWFFRTRVQLPNGRRRRLSGTPSIGAYRDLPNTQAAGREAERRAINAAMTGVTNAEQTAKEVASKTIREHAETFVSTYKPGSKPAEKYEKQRVLDTHLLPVFGDLAIPQLTQAAVDDYSNSELARISQVTGKPITAKTVNNQLAVLSTLIKYVTGERSTLRFKLDGMDGELQAVVAEDVELLLEVAKDPRYRALILLGSEAGFRSGEVRGLQWTDIKNGAATIRRALDKRTNAVTAPKHNKMRTVPLSPRILDALDRVPRTGLWVFASTNGGCMPYQRMAITIAGLYDLAGVSLPAKPMHALRHTFGTVMAKQVPLGTLCKLMGHADIKTTLRYVDVAEDDKRAAIAKVFAWPASGQQGRST